jgi:hypothetical protein
MEICYNLLKGNVKPFVKKYEKKMVHRLHRLTQRGWHPQPIIAAGIRKYRREKF